MAALLSILKLIGKWGIHYIITQFHTYSFQRISFVNRIGEIFLLSMQVNLFQQGIVLSTVSILYTKCQFEIDAVFLQNVEMACDSYFLLIQ